MKNQTRHDVIIIGAGFSGLGAGIQAQRNGLSSLILEAEGTPGGLCRNTTVADCDFDLGPKIILIDNEVEGADLLSYFNGSYDKLPMVERVYSAEFGFTGFPVQRHLHDLPESLRRSVIREIKSLNKNNTAENYDEWLRGLFGDTLSESILIPYEEKKWLMSLKEMDYSWALTRPVRVNYEEMLMGSKKHLEPNRYYYYPSIGNISTLSNKLANDAGTIKYNSKVSYININKKYVIANDVRYYFDHLISTMPFDEELKIMNNKDTAQDHIDLETERCWLSIKVLNLVFEGTFNSDLTAIYFPDRDIIFRRVSLVGNLCPALKRDGLTPISVEVSISDELSQISDEIIMDVSVKDLRKIPGFSNLGDLIDYQVIEIPNAYPLQRNGIHDYISKTHDELKKYEIYHCGRNGTFNYCNSDIAYLQGKAVINEIVSKTKR